MTHEEEQIIRAIAAGQSLKSHRNIDGHKVLLLHPLGDGEPQQVDGDVVWGLTEQGILYSNQKFPAATFLLTDSGAALAETLLGGPIKPMGGSR